MGSASSTYRPKCIYLDIDGRIQKVLSLFFHQVASPDAAAAAGGVRCTTDPCTARHPAGSRPFLRGKGGILRAFCFVHGCLFKGEGEAGRGEGWALPTRTRRQLSLPAWGCSVSQPCWLPLPERRRAVFTKFSLWRGFPRRQWEQGSTACRAPRTLPARGFWPWASPSGRAAGQAGARLFVRCRCIAGGCGVPAASAKVARKRR